MNQPAHTRREILAHLYTKIWPDPTTGHIFSIIARHLSDPQLNDIYQELAQCPTPAPSSPSSYSPPSPGE